MAARKRTAVQGLFAVIALIVTATGEIHAQPTGEDFISLEGEVNPVGEEVLATSRGGSMLIGGIQVDVTGMLRLLTDGQEILTQVGSDVAFHGIAAQQINLRALDISNSDAVFDHPIFVNTLDSVVLEQYREINLHFRDLPVGLGRVPVVPDLLLMHATDHY